MRLALQARMGTINSYKDLKVWQLGMDLVDACFDVVDDALPQRYRFTFSNQLLDAAVSIPSNPTWPCALRLHDSPGDKSGC
jgi:hypothetical protein